jgi:hypothetical protein
VRPVFTNRFEVCFCRQFVAVPSPPLKLASVTGSQAMSPAAAMTGSCAVAAAGDIRQAARKAGRRVRSIGDQGRAGVTYRTRPLVTLVSLRQEPEGGDP